MFQPKESVFDRIEQTFEFIKKNIFKLTIPIFIYNFVCFGVIYLVSLKYILSVFSSIDTVNTDSFLSILYSGQGVLIISVMIFLSLLYALLYIPFFIATIKTIDQVYKGENTSVKKNIVYGFSRILDIFKVYWYIFKYVYLIPAVIFILGGILFNISYFINASIEMTVLTYIAIILMLISLFNFIVFSIYRGLQTTFSIYTAVDNNNFTENNFRNNIKITKNKLLRIFGNLFLIGMIISFVSGFIGGIVGIITPNAVTTNIDKLIGEDDVTQALNGGNIDFASIISDIEFDVSTLFYLFDEFINQGIATIFIVFGFVFTYIFMKRLEIESSEEKKNRISQS